MLVAGPLIRRRSSLLRFGILAFILLVATWQLYPSPENLVRFDLNLTPPAAGSHGTPQHDKGRKNKPTDADTAKPQPAKPDSTPPRWPEATLPATASEDPHPIEKLMFDAQRQFAAISSGESKTLEQAAQAYRKARGRHPPPHFDKWFEYAQSHHALMVEGFFDQIYEDLESFWGIDPAPMRREASQFEMTISVRNGTATAKSDWMWTKIWLNMTKTIETLLPDMDIALNAMDEPRLVVPWEDVNGYMKTALSTRKLANVSETVNEFHAWPDPKTGSLAGDVADKNWEKDEFYWKIVRRGCPPDSLARTTPLQGSWKEPPTINNTYAEPHLHKGYVSNYTKSIQVCHQPDLQGLEGILIRPLSTKSTKVMIPLFGGSKLTVNNEILLPAPMYYSEEERFIGNGNHGIEWPEKTDKAIWRGVATGGRNTEHNWRGFQRHRFVAMNNGTKIARVESGEDRAENFALPGESYGVQASAGKSLGHWVDEFADVGFIDLMCSYSDQRNKCNYTDFYFNPIEGIKLSEQFNYKYLPDIDGNSFSGRYLGFLRSTSLPIKSTIFREWHDSRLVPWKHFVPMDNRFTDYYGIMEFFRGYRDRGAHDEAARKIAMEGKEWAERVLRKEDMRIYMLRLLLEYARVMDDDRELMGWTGDVVKKPSLAKPWSSWW
ncbi:Lipopolysaccharide-modifying protein [Metarhizium album ARSEF 1941]|uniref:Lipopolysaccharide-modifying protein n=1 Tax=Metarhizium album (strain ARSEF 1941) TaxID=1081103 RepID=A0A0B2WV58_METAS|nr:Lipopolysaccharide-modifying protein [Metarhizium album ARSEF 1941]KHN97332.1 Lipopolysaccharide-modifying protein [Metarhizium album ARSEF 1941]